MRTSNYIRACFFLWISCCHPMQTMAQEQVTVSIKDFGAKGDGLTNDQDAFVKASSFFNQRKGNGNLLIPEGVYIVGRQHFTGKATDKGTNAYTGENVIDLKNCGNMSIIGTGNVVLKHSDSLRIGTFSPADGKPFLHTDKEIYLNENFYNYRTSVGNIVYTHGCSNINISGLGIDGNVGNFIFGGNWGIGRNAYELIHYGIYILDSHDITVQDCTVKNMGCDGIYIANIGTAVKTYRIFIDQCSVLYSGRNGLSWLGGEQIRVTNSEFSHSGQGTVHESPAAGIDIEVENGSACRSGYFYNCRMENNIGSAITSGSRDRSSDVLFKNCMAASPKYYTVFADAASHRFEDCTFYGTVLVWYRAKKIKDAVQFKRCRFEENYQGKKMYDGSYQLGITATSVQVDSCVFRAFTTSSYYIAGMEKDCSQENLQKISVSNCIIYNYNRSTFGIAAHTAGMAGYTVFKNNRFYTFPGIRFENWFNANCNADAGGNDFIILKENE